MVVADATRLVVATQDGALRALDPTTLRPLWPADFARGTSGRPRLVLFGDLVVVAGCDAMNLDGADLWGVDAATGQLTWQARLPGDRDPVISLASDGELLLVTTTRGSVHVFDREGP